MTDANSSVVEALCSGSPREMGLAQGKALRSKILLARDILARLESFRLLQPRWLPYSAYRWLAERRAARMVPRMLRTDSRDLVDRLEGLADGAGLSRQSLALFNVMEPLLSSVGGCTTCPGACSAVAVRGSRSTTGEPVIARNFDYLPMVQPLYTVRRCLPERGLASVEFTSAPLVGAIDGINEAGLAITYDYAYVTDGPSLAPPISMVIAEAMGTCRTVAEAAERIASRPRWGGGLLMLADAGGDIASLELSNTRSHLRRPAPGQDILFHTNSFFSDAMKSVQISPEAVFDDRAPRALRGRRLHHSSETRNRRYEELLAPDRPFGLAELGAIMADHGPDNVPGDYTPCVHGTYWFTTAAVQLLPAARRMRIAFDTSCRAKHEEIFV